MIKDCLLIGINAGADLIDGENVVIIGDNIRSLDRSQKGVLFIGEKVAIGKTLFGESINLFDLIVKYCPYEFVEKTKH